MSAEPDVLELDGNPPAPPPKKRRSRAATQQNALTVQATAAVLSPLELVQMAVAKGFDADRLQKLIDMQAHWLADEARRAYAQAMVAFKQQLPRIVATRFAQIKHKDRSGGREPVGVTEYFYANLGDVQDVLLPALAAAGFTHRWKLGEDGDKITVSCVITHVGGHSEEGVTLKSLPDYSGNKSAPQAVKSSVTYLQRITVLAATGLSTAEGDNDGATDPATERSRKRDTDPTIIDIETGEPKAPPSTVQAEREAAAAMLREFHKAALKGMAALKAHYTRNVPPEGFWKSFAGELRRAATAADRAREDAEEQAAE